MSAEGYGIIPDEEIQKVEVKVVAYLTAKKQRGVSGCASLGELAEYINMDKDRLLRYIKQMTSVDLIKPARILVTPTGFTVTEDWYVSLRDEDCFGTFAKTAMEEVQHRKQLYNVIEQLADLPPKIDTLSKEVKEFSFDIIGLEKKIDAVGKKIDEIYSILTQGGVKHGRRKKRAK